MSSDQHDRRPTDGPAPARADAEPAPPRPRAHATTPPPAGEPAQAGVPATARRRTVARYDDYIAAQSAVDYLSDERFPVESVTIVGTGLRYEEQVTGRRGLGRATLEAAVTGAVLGALLGWFFGLFSLVNPLVSGFALALWGALLGGLLGALLGALGHAATGGRRDFSSFRGYTAAEYEVLVEESRADEAERLLERMPARR